MQTFRLRAGDEFIRLGQVLKAAGIAGTGSEAKEMIQNGEVTVNGQEETRRGRKLYPGDIVLAGTEELLIEGGSGGEIS